jgi:hypothetical protein
MTSWAWAGGSTRSGPFPGRAGFRASSAGRSASPTRGCRNRGIWFYEPTGRVGHWIPRQRTTFRYFARRCFHEGQGKAALAALDGARPSTAAERSYTYQILPQGVLRALQDTAEGDAWGAARAAAIAVGFATTAAGFAAGWLTWIGLPLLASVHGRQARAIEHADATNLAAIALTLVRVR